MGRFLVELAKQLVYYFERWFRLRVRRNNEAQLAKERAERAKELDAKAAAVAGPGDAADLLRGTFNGNP